MLPEPCGFLPLPENPFFASTTTSHGPRSMKKRVTFPAFAALLLMLLPFTACEKAPEYVDGPDTTTVGGTSEPVTVFSASYTWSDSVGDLLFKNIGDQTWTEEQVVIEVPITMALQPGDRVITMLQLGLQKTGLACEQNMFVDAGCILDQAGVQLPVEPADSESGVILRDQWDGDELTRQFTRYRESAVTASFTTAVVRAFAKPWSGDAGCVGDPAVITNCSLTVMVVPGP